MPSRARASSGAARFGKPDITERWSCWQSARSRRTSRLRGFRIRRERYMGHLLSLCRWWIDLHVPAEARHVAAQGEDVDLIHPTNALSRGHLEDGSEGAVCRAR